MSARGIIVLLMCVLVIACEEATDLPLSSEELSTLVVEGILTNEKINHRIKLSLPYGRQNGNADPATGAIVKIKDGSDSISLTEFPIGSGEYYTPQVRAVFGKTYTLTIQYQGKEYLAQDRSEPVEPFLPLDYRKVDDLYTLNLYETGQNANFISHDISWKNTSSCASGEGCEGKVVFYDLKTIDVNEIYKPGKEEFNFPANSIVVRKKYSVSPTYKAFLRSVLSETEWRGGIFDVQRGNATTNLNEGAIGFFAVSTVLSDSTLIVELP